LLLFISLVSDPESFRDPQGYEASGNRGRVSAVRGLGETVEK